MFPRLSSSVGVDACSTLCPNAHNRRKSSLINIRNKVGERQLPRRSGFRRRTFLISRKQYYSTWERRTRATNCDASVFAFSPVALFHLLSQPFLVLPHS
eukprot:scaffold133_cov169-Amphora_coffeaeformis.AAC.6